MSKQTRSRRSWTRAEKQRLVEEARTALRSGETFVAVAQRLEVQPTSLRLWMRQFPERVLLRPVEVEVEDDRRSTGIVVSTPDGFRVEGLDVDGAIVVVECLR